MRISELSQRAGVPLSTIKFYIREGLLLPGERTGPNQARYEEEHIRRLELIRALREVCGLGIETTRRVLAAMDDPDITHEPIRLAIQATGPPAPERSPEQQASLDAARDEVAAFLDGLDWTRPGEHGEFADALASSLVEVRRLVDPETPVDFLAPYARAAWALSEAELSGAPRGEEIQPRPGDPMAYPVRMAILGILLAEPVLTVLRRYALFARGSRAFEGLPVPEARPIVE
jgi:DNA-binding transcriptional MerR regulator